MYLFSRQIRFGPGNTREQMEWALQQTEKVNQITGLQVNLFMQVYSPEVGAVGWSTFVPDLPTLEAAADKLQPATSRKEWRQASSSHNAPRRSWARPRCSSPT